MQYIQNRQIECWISRNFLIVLTVCSLPYRMSFLGFMIFFCGSIRIIFGCCVHFRFVVCSFGFCLEVHLGILQTLLGKKCPFIFNFALQQKFQHIVCRLYFLIYLIVLLFIRMRKIIKTMKAVMKKVKMKKTVVINKYHITNVVFLGVIQNGIQKQKKQKYLSFL